MSNSTVSKVIIGSSSDRLRRIELLHAIANLERVWLLTKDDDAKEDIRRLLESAKDILFTQFTKK